MKERQKDFCLSLIMSDIVVVCSVFNKNLDTVFMINDIRNLFKFLEKFLTKLLSPCYSLFNNHNTS